MIAPALPAAPMTTSDWGLSLDSADHAKFSGANHDVVTVSRILTAPDRVINCTVLQKFAQITPQYPGIRAAIPDAAARHWVAWLGPHLNQWFAPAACRWEMQAWFSLVTTAPGALLPMQRFPHVDGTDPDQIAMMLYLHRTGHGGTAFFRHRATGLSALTAADYPRYAETLRHEVQRSGLPAPAYPTDGAPHFERIHTAPGTFNSAVFYRGNILHSGVIDNHAPLPSDPRSGRLTINAFFRPVAG